MGLAVVIFLAAVPQALGGPTILPPVPAQIALALDSLPTIGAHGSVVYSFKGSAGPLAYDFDDTNATYAYTTGTTPLTTAQYVFNGALLDGKDTPVSAQWSPASNLTGRFVHFLGFDALGYEDDSSLSPTKVAKIVDANGNSYGYILADYGVTDPSKDNTTFTFVNTSPYAIDPTITGEQIGITLPELFTGTAPTVTPPSGTGGLTYGPAINVNGGGGFSVSGIQAKTPTGSTNPSTLILTASEGFTAINSSATNTLTMTAGSVIVATNGTTTNKSGGTGSIAATATITNAANQTVQTLTLPTINFSATYSQLPHTQSFNASSASGGLSLTPGASYTAVVKWTVKFTPGDQYTQATVDPNLIFYNQPFFSTPAPPSLVLALVGAVCLGGFVLLSRRTRRQQPGPLAA